MLFMFLGVSCTVSSLYGVFEHVTRRVEYGVPYLLAALNLSLFGAGLILLESDINANPAIAVMASALIPGLLAVIIASRNQKRRIASLGTRI